MDVQSALAHAKSSISERYTHLSEATRQKTSHIISNVVAGAIEDSGIKSGRGRSAEVGL